MFWIYIQTKLVEELYFEHDVSSLTETCLEGAHLLSKQLDHLVNH